MEHKEKNAMTDYYAELNIDSSLGVDEINKELSKLENTWKRRELTNPEKATKMLAIIIDAREVFKSTTTKNRYDRELAESKQQSKPVDSNQQRKDEIKKWRTDADTYYDRGEYDLAKIAVDRALALVADSSDDDLYSLAAAVYMEVGEHSVALSFINNAIVTNPQNGLHYMVKAGIYGRSASALKFSDRYKSSQYYEEERKTLQIGLNVANSTGDTYAKSRLLGALAFSLYFEANPDRVRAEELAREALALGENLGNAQKVIDAVNEQHRAEEQAAREQREKEEVAENARKDGVYQEAKRIATSNDISELKKAISKFESISDYKDSTQQIEDIISKIQGIVDKAEEEKQHKIKKHKSRNKVILCSIPIIAIAIVIGLFVTNNMHHKCGENLKWEYDADAKVLTITGAGPMYDDYEPYSASLGGDHNRTRPWDSDEIYDKINTIIIEDGCTHIGEYAFDGLSNLTEVSIPDSVTSIGNSAFDWCERLTHIELPRNLTSIDGAIFWASGIKTLHIPGSVESLRAIADGATYLEEITVDENNNFFTSVDGVLFSKDMTILWAYPQAKADESYIIPESVTELGSAAFRFSENLKSVYIPESVTELGWHTFEDCTNLVDINIPKNITILPEEIFGGCGFVNLAIPEHIVEIGYREYSMCWSLETVNIPDGVETIGDYAFSSCYGLMDITIPVSVISIGSMAFEDCKENSIIHYAGTTDQWISIASNLSFAGTVECSDGNYHY